MKKHFENILQIAYESSAVKNPAVVHSISPVRSLLTLSDGQEYPVNNVQTTLTPITSVPEIENGLEHLLAIPGALVPISSAFADDIQAVKLTYQVLNAAEMLNHHRPDVVQKIDALYKRGLLTLHGKDGVEGYRPNEKFRTLYCRHFNLAKFNGSTHAIFDQVDIEESLNNFKPIFCILNVPSKYAFNTILLLPEHSHMGFYCKIGNLNIYWSYLTSDQNPSNILLSNNQPVGDDVNKKNRPQMLHLCNPAFIVSNDALSGINKTTQTEIDIYLKDPDVKQKLKTIFKEQIITKMINADTMHLYDGAGITLEQINTVLQEADKTLKAKAQRSFNKTYVIRLNNDIEKANKPKHFLAEYLNKMQQADPEIYPYLLQIINEYNEKNNIPERHAITQ